MKKCPKIERFASSRDDARDFFRYFPVDNVLFPSRAVARETA